MKDTLIGEDMDGAVSGISGGERRRVSVGIGAPARLFPIAWHLWFCILVPQPCACQLVRDSYGRRLCPSRPLDPS